MRQVSGSERKPRRRQQSSGSRGVLRSPGGMRPNASGGFLGLELHERGHRFSTGGARTHPGFFEGRATTVGARHFEGTVEMHLVDARATKQVIGRKSDVLDCRRIGNTTYRSVLLEQDRKNNLPICAAGGESVWKQVGPWRDRGQTFRGSLDANWSLAMVWAAQQRWQGTCELVFERGEAQRELFRASVRSEEMTGEGEAESSAPGATSGSARCASSLGGARGGGMHSASRATRWASIRSMRSGASMHAMTRSVPPHRGQCSMSIWKTRMRRCIQFIGEVGAWRAFGDLRGGYGEIRIPTVTGSVGGRPPAATRPSA